MLFVLFTFQMISDDLVYGVPGEGIVIFFDDPVRVIAKIRQMTDSAAIGKIPDKILERLVKVLIFHAENSFYAKG